MRCTLCRLSRSRGPYRGPRHAGTEADSMRFFDSITSRVIVWLAAILIPVAAQPSATCGCGGHSWRSEMVCGQKNANAPPKCPHCTVHVQPRPSCCHDSAGEKERSSCCSTRQRCSTGQACCCLGGTNSGGKTCQCSKNQTAPAPAPLPTDSRPHDTTSWAMAFGGGPANMAVVFPPAFAIGADQRPVNLGSSVPERLSVLCRFLI